MNAPGTACAATLCVPHLYPAHLRDFSYVGRLSYALEFTTKDRFPGFLDRDTIDVVVQQFRRAANERGFQIVIHCLMPDHAHLVIDGQRDDSDGLAFIKAAKQYSGYYFKQAFGRPLWQRYGYERVIRDDRERALTIRYVLANPVRAGLVADPRDYYGLGSQVHSVDELMLISEYTLNCALE